MSFRSLLSNIISLISANMHKRGRDASIACVQSLMNGSMASMTSIGRDVRGKVLEKHLTKHADRL